MEGVQDSLRCKGANCKHGGLIAMYLSKSYAFHAPKFGLFGKAH
jgi:hypothetical protein